MALKSEIFNLQDYNLAINCTGQNLKQNGLAKYIKNGQVKNGKISSTSNMLALADLLDSSGKLGSQFSNLGDIVAMQFFEVFYMGQTYSYLIICSQDFKIYYYQIGLSDAELTRLEDIQLTSIPLFETYIAEDKNLLLISSVTDEMWIWDGITTPLEVLDAPKVTSMAVGLERLFVVCKDSPYKVFYSDDKDPSNWSISSGDAGELCFVDNLGSVVKVVALDNYIFVIRQNGIIKIYATASQTTFKQSKVFVSTGKIYPNSISVVGDKIVFLTTDGLYTFDGLNAKKICSAADDFFAKDNEDCFAVCLDNTYYLGAKINNLNGRQEQAIVQLDLQNLCLSCVMQESASSGFVIDCQYFRGVCFLCSLKQKEITAEDENEQLQDVDNLLKTAKVPLILLKNTTKTAKTADFLYFSNSINLSPNQAIKTLNKLYITVEFDCELQISTEQQSKTLLLKASPYSQTFMLGICGKNFWFSFSGQKDVEIKDMQIDYTYVL